MIGDHDGAIENFFNSAMPNVRDEVRLGTLLLSDVTLVAERLIQEKYDKCDSVFIFGSIITGEYKRYSDVDIIVVEDESSYIRKSRFIYEGIPFEIQSFGINNLDNLKDFCLRKRSLIIFPGLETGNVLLDYNNNSKMIQEFACDFIRKGPMKNDERVKRNLRMILTGEIIEIITNVDFYLNSSIITSLYSTLITSIFYCNNMWMTQGKWIGKRLSIRDREIWDEIERSFFGAIHGSKKEIINLALRVLNFLGGPLWHEFSDQCKLVF